MPLSYGIEEIDNKIIKCCPCQPCIIYPTESNISDERIQEHIILNGNCKRIITLNYEAGPVINPPNDPVSSVPNKYEIYHNNNLIASTSGWVGGSNFSQDPLYQPFIGGPVGSISGIKPMGQNKIIVKVYGSSPSKYNISCQEIPDVIEISRPIETLAPGLTQTLTPTRTPTPTPTVKLFNRCRNLNINRILFKQYLLNGDYENSTNYIDATPFLLIPNGGTLLSYGYSTNGPNTGLTLYQPFGKYYITDISYTDNYTLILKIKFNNIPSSYGKLLDFKNRADTTGLFLKDGKINFWKVNGGDVMGSVVLNTSMVYDIWIVRQNNQVCISVTDPSGTVIDEIGFNDELYRLASVDFSNVLNILMNDRYISRPSISATVYQIDILKNNSPSITPII